MSTVDPLKRTRQDDAFDGTQAAADRPHLLDQDVLTDAHTGKVPSNDTSATSLPQSEISTRPRPLVPLDPAYVRKREEALALTNEILRQRCAQKLDRLNELKKAHAQAQAQAQAQTNRQSPLSKNVNSVQDKQLKIMRMEEARLQAECDKMKSGQGVFPQTLPELSKLHIRQKIQEAIHDYGVMTPRLKNELEETKAELASEKQLLLELREINQALQARRNDLKQLIESGMSQESSQRRQVVLETQAQVRELMRELTRFLGKHYPPVQPQNDDPTTFQLKDVLEDIMNLSVSQPSDPYVVLVPGEYYPPHIEQLINAGIAVRHPRDSQKLRLVDFYS